MNLHNYGPVIQTQIALPGMNLEGAISPLSLEHLLVS